jgi:hypothetical protein
MECIPKGALCISHHRRSQSIRLYPAVCAARTVLHIATASLGSSGHPSTRTCLFCFIWTQSNIVSGPSGSGASTSETSDRPRSNAFHLRPVVAFALIRLDSLPHLQAHRFPHRSSSRGSSQASEPIEADFPARAAHEARRLTLVQYPQFVISSPRPVKPAAAAAALSSSKYRSSFGGRPTPR